MSFKGFKKNKATGKYFFAVSSILCDGALISVIVIAILKAMGLLVMPWKLVIAAAVTGIAMYAILAVGALISIDVAAKKQVENERYF